jgi:hypothetical protein
MTSDVSSIGTIGGIATITAVLHDASSSMTVTFDPLSGIESSYASLVVNGNVATLKLDNDPPNNIQCNIVARYSGDGGATLPCTLQVTLLKASEPSISLVSDTPYLQNVNDIANISTDFHNFASQAVQFELGTPNANVTLSDADPTDGACTLILNQTVNVPTIVTIIGTTASPPPGGDDIVGTIDITLAPPEPTP